MEQALTAQRHAVKSLIETRLREGKLSVPETPMRSRKFSIANLIDNFLHNFWGRFNIREQVAAQIVKGVFWLGVTLLVVFLAPKAKDIGMFIYQSFVTSHSSGTKTNNQNISISDSPGATVIQGASSVEK